MLEKVVVDIDARYGAGEARQARGTKPDNDDPTVDPTSVDLIECDICGAWVAGDRCERDNCPY